MQASPGDRLIVDGVLDLAVDVIVQTHRDALSLAMAAGATH